MWLINSINPKYHVLMFDLHPKYASVLQNASGPVIQLINFVSLAVPLSVPTQI